MRAKSIVDDSSASSGRASSMPPRASPSDGLRGDQPSRPRNMLNVRFRSTRITSASDRAVHRSASSAAPCAGSSAHAASAQA